MVLKLCVASILKFLDIQKGYVSDKLLLDIGLIFWEMYPQAASSEPTKLF